MIGIITYDTRHFKTEQLIIGLLERGEKISTIYALPFVPRPERKVLFQHRPFQMRGIHPSQLARTNNIRYVTIDNKNEFFVEEPLALVTIGVIIPETTLETTAVINCHPGLIPEVRGLDAFKWAIHDGFGLGNTLHYIDKDVDCGEIIHKESTQILPDDNIETLAKRHYERELELNINFRNYLPGTGTQVDNTKRPQPNRRMPIHTEKIMLQRFEKYREKYAQ